MKAADSPFAEAAPPAPVGGFFERHEPGGLEAGPSVLRTWTQGRDFAAFVNARSAFAALAAAFPGAAIWAPAYICADLIQPPFANRVRFYPVLDGFEPDLEAVEAGAGTGDILLLTAHFGLPISDRTRAFARRRGDLRIVQDRAMALDAADASGEHWLLYSPRKLLGVADGGILVAPHGADLPAKPAQAADAASLWAPCLARHEDPAGRDSATWHALNQAKERRMAVSREAMTPSSLSILERTAFDSVAAPRVRNWGLLDRRLRPWSALPASSGAALLGYVLRLEPDVRDELRRRLHAERIFAAVHWPAIAAPPARFQREQAWTAQLITLPCDHRYGEADMDRIATIAADMLA